MTERDKVRTLVRFRDAVVNLISVSGGMAFQKYREACEDVLAMALGRRPTDEELDDLLCERRPGYGTDRR